MENLVGSVRCQRCGRKLKAPTRRMKTASFHVSPDLPEPIPPDPSPPQPPVPPPPADPEDDFEEEDEEEFEEAETGEELEEEETEEDDDAEPSETEARQGAAQPKKRIGTCDICKGVFPQKDLVDFGAGYVCEDCLERKPGLLEKTAVKLRRVPRPPDKEKGEKAIHRDRDSHETYLHRKTYIQRYEKKKGTAPSSTTLIWPKCFRHPNRSTKDRCHVCKKPICAMCIKRRAGFIYCPGCFSRSSQVLKVHESGKYAGLSGSFFEAVREALFDSTIFFRNLPTRGRVVPPFVFALVAWIIGSIVVLALLWLFAYRQGAFEIETFLDATLKPVLLGGLICGGAVALLAPLPLHLLASGLGGNATFNQSMRMFCLASAYHYLFIIPFIGWPIGVLLSFLVFPRAITEVHGLGLFKSFFLYILLAAGLAGGYFATGAFIFSSHFFI
jgi:hypothetical protein